MSIVHLPSEKEDVETLKEQFESIGRRFFPIEADLLCESSWKQVIERHMFEFGQLDILVNNAARQHIYESIEELENAKKTFKLNNIAMLALINMLALICNVVPVSFSPPLLLHIKAIQTL